MLEFLNPKKKLNGPPRKIGIFEGTKIPFYGGKIKVGETKKSKKLKIN